MIDPKQQYIIYKSYNQLFVKDILKANQLVNY